MSPIFDLNDKSDDEVLSSTFDSVGDERRAIARVIGHLVAVEERGIHLELAYSSLYDFCHRGLKLSEGPSRRRSETAKLVKRFPCLFEPLQDGRLHMCGIVELKRVLTEENAETIVAEAIGKTTRQIREMVARLRPKPDVDASIEKLPDGPSDAKGQTSARSCPPLSPDRYHVQFTASGELRDKLEKAQALLRHRQSSCDLASVVEAAMDAFIEKAEKELMAKARPRATKAPKDRGAVTAATRREVFERDGAQCSYVSRDGVRCEARAFLQVDHIEARARGGKGDLDNTRVFCAAHNFWHAQKTYGRELIEQKIAERRAAQAARNATSTSTALIVRPADNDNLATSSSDLRVPR